MAISGKSAEGVAPAAAVTGADRAGTSAGGLLRALLVTVQLVLVLLVVWRYELESRTFFNVMALATGGFLVHSLLPLRYRLPFFVCLSLATVLVAFGFADGAWLVALGLALIGICHLPLRLAARVGLLLLVGAAFGAFRAGLIEGPWSVAIWPILGSMFMFRLALYLYALEHEEKQPTVAGTLAYFFMLPNVCFPLYPVVDYQSFRRNYYDRDASAIYETGIKWIVRGLVQLVLYRYVYVFMAGDATRLESLGELVQFLLSTFLLYLRVSGQFHLICGMLYLFGFRLPETHHLYFLASSFTDFWRRINIYWKDFMMKLFYYPAFFRLKRYGTRSALVMATLIVFLGTWLLHSYQWFWLRGGFPLEPQDGLFWGILGVLVVVGSLRELKSSPRRKLGPASKRWSFSLAWRTVATFWMICLLWSLWSTESLVTWVLMWGAAQHTTWREVLVLAVLMAVALAIAGRPWQNLDSAIPAGPTRLRWTGVIPVVGLIGLLALSAREWYAPAAPALASTVAALQKSTLNARDAALQQKGYYENLDNQSRMSAQLWEVTAQKPAHWGSLLDAGGLRNRDDFLRAELIPNVSVTFLDQPLTTNSWGMRDRERALAKPPGTYRIALIGPSHVMGSGVADQDTFARALEDRLNASDLAATGRGIEVLNFGVPDQALTQQLVRFREDALRFRPDAVIFTDGAHSIDSIVGHVLWTMASGHKSPSERLNAALRDTGTAALRGDGIPVPYQGLRSLLESAGVRTRMPWAEAHQRVRRSAEPIIRTVLEEMVGLARSHGVVPIFLGLDNVVPPPGHRVPVLRDAAAAGMLVFDLFDLWADRDVEPLRIAPWDNHPNAAGSQIIAARLTELIRQHARELRLPGEPAENR